MYRNAAEALRGSTRASHKAYGLAGLDRLSEVGAYVADEMNERERRTGSMGETLRYHTAKLLGTTLKDEPDSLYELGRRFA